MRRSLILLALLATTSLAHAQRLTSSEEGRWSLQLPASFTAAPERKVPMSTQIGEVTMNLTMAQSPDGNNLVMVAYCDYPEAIFSMGSSKVVTINKMLDSARDGGLRNVPKAKLISEKKTQLNGLPGRSIVFSGSSQGKKVYARFDYYIDVPRLYQIGYITTSRASIESAPVRTMFASLALRPLTATGPQPTEEGRINLGSPNR